MADVCILGAGMAGLTLAAQLKTRDPSLTVTLVEHRGFPAPTAAYKVGESTVEIAAHYLAEELGLREHLESAHLPKFGLRLFFGGGRGPRDMAAFDEVGASQVLPVPTYQIDRGVLENYLAERARADGLTLLDRTTIRDVHIEPGRHRVTVSSQGEPHTIRCRFLVDASGRRAWLRNRRQLTRQTQHHNGAVWFRVASELNVDDWSTDRAWRARCHGASRRLSTNHFMGPGYWVWVIPLACGATSIGVVYDPAVVDATQLDSHDAVMGWLGREQPLLAGHLAGAPVMDFHTMKHYAAGCRQTYSSDGWMLCGDAGVFADPLYSPGGDFIALGNTFISELIAGRCPGAAAAAYQRYLLGFFSNTLSVFRGQYPGFGHRDLMVLKTLWDYAYYWSVLAKLYFSRRMVDVDFMAAIQQELVRASALNARMQKQFRRLGSLQRCQGGEGGFVDHYQVPWFHELKHDLINGRPDHTAAALSTGIRRLSVLADSLSGLLDDVAAARPLPDLDQIAGLT